MVWVLAGFMGCGKSSVGRLVARMAACPDSLLPPESFPSSPENGSAGKAPDGSGAPAQMRVARPSEVNFLAEKDPDGSGAFATGRNSDDNLPAQAVSGATGRNTGDNLPGQAFSEAAGRNPGENLPAQLVFVDLDAEIEAREGRSIREIFAEGGEAAFRAVERETLAELLYRSGVLPLREFASLTPPSADADGPPASVPRVARPSGAIATSSGNPSAKLLISLGGGTLTDPESRELVRKHCRCIYLRASLETLAENLRWEGEAATRPMLAGADPKAPAESPDSLESRISAMMDSRAPIYEKAADVIIDIDGLDYSDIARLVLNSFSL